VWTILGSLVSVVFNGAVDIYKEIVHRRDVEELARRKQVDAMLQRYAVEMRRLEGLGHAELAREVEAEFGADAAARGRALLERLRGGGA